MGFWEDASPATKYTIIGGVVAIVIVVVLFIWPGVLMSGGEPTTAERGVDMSRGVPAEKLIKKAGE